MTKPTDEEAAARRVLAHRVRIDLREQLLLLDFQARRKRPSLDGIRDICETISRCMDGHLTDYDHKHGTASERTATMLRLRILNAKLVQDNDRWASDIKLLRAALEKSNAQLRASVHLVEAIVAWCDAEHLTIPHELMGPPQ